MLHFLFIKESNQRRCEAMRGQKEERLRMRSDNAVSLFSLKEFKHASFRQGKRVTPQPTLVFNSSTSSREVLR